MPLESASYLNQLEVSNPASTDAMAQADDHLRLIKSVLKNTFPNINGPVTSTPAELNDAKGLRTDVEKLKTDKFDKAGGAITGNIQVTGVVNAATVQQGGNTLVPRGTVVMWWGDLNAIPAGWAMCNGQTVNGLATPDLRDRFIVGAGVTYAVGQAGGSVFPSFASTTNGAHGHSAWTDAQGNHAHGGGTAGHALTVDQIPPHSHQEFAGQGYGSFNGWNLVGAGVVQGLNVNTGNTGGGQAHAHGIYADGNHAHNVGISVEGNHAHSITIDTRSPYVALAFIIKL